jgi:hypothetical protein
LSPATAHPDSAWVTQQARNLANEPRWPLTGDPVSHPRQGREVQRPIRRGAALGGDAGDPHAGPGPGHGWHRSSHPVRFRATYHRTAGVRHLLAAYDPATGRITGHIRATKTWREVRELLRTLRARFREHLLVICDNFSPHKKPELRPWVAEHDIELVYLPTYSSWLNLIECQFQALRRRMVDLGVEAPGLGGAGVAVVPAQVGVDGPVLLGVARVVRPVEGEPPKNRVLDLYANPPAGCRVLCLDEFGPLNLQPRLERCGMRH